MLEYQYKALARDIAYRILRVLQQIQSNTCRFRQTHGRGNS